VLVTFSARIEEKLQRSSLKAFSLKSTSFQLSSTANFLIQGAENQRLHWGIC
jgi:hypothetical protein